MRLEQTGVLIGLMILSQWTIPLEADDGPARGSRAKQAVRNVVSATEKPDPEEEPERTYPSLPGAVRELPGWFQKNAPFDVARHFAVVPPDENAAPLYLDALYEFAPNDMKLCVAPEERDARERALVDREARTLKIMREGAADARDRLDLLAEYGPAFEKIAAAQKRKQCVFETGLGIDAMLHHAQASRAVVRLLEWQVEFHVADGKIDAAIDDVEAALRLSCDLRPRGPIIAQLVSMALDAVVCQGFAPRILGGVALESGECDRLLTVLERHVGEEVDPVSEGFRTEYLIFRDLLHRLEMKEALGDRAGVPGSSNGIALVKMYGSAPGKKSLEVAAQLDEILGGMSAKDFAVDVESLNTYFAPLVEKAHPSLSDLHQRYGGQPRSLEGSRLFDLLNAQFLPAVPQAIEAFRRNRTRNGAIQCLVALRRWEITQSGKLPPDLLTVCKAAGMKSVPIDEYSATREPLRMTLLNNEPVVYSVATDGKDDRALRDWNWGQAKGDWSFRLPVRPCPSARQIGIASPENLLK